MLRILLLLTLIVAAVSLARAATIAVSPITHMVCGSIARSLVSDTSLHLVFANQTKQSVSIYWLDFKGERVWYNTLAPGESYSQQTYVTHPWVVIDADGKCVAQLVATAAGTFEIPIR